jgi:hypothetical protein
MNLFGQIIQRPNDITMLEQFVCQVRTDESSATGDKCFLQHTVRNSSQAKEQAGVRLMAYDSFRNSSQVASGKIGGKQFGNEQGDSLAKAEAE